VIEEDGNVHLNASTSLLQIRLLKDTDIGIRARQKPVVSLVE
jgi:hypothetical protein